MSATPYGLCECGCGQPAPIAKKSHTKQGRTKGTPMHFVHGHNQRGKRQDENSFWKGDEASPHAIHRWLNRNYLKTGVCEECGKIPETHTEYAFLRHPEPYTRERSDYRELCRGCHTRFDEPLYDRGAKMRERKRQLRGRPT